MASVGDGRSDEDILAIGRRLIAAEAICAARGEVLNAPARRVLKALLASGRPMKAYDLMHAVGNGVRSAAPPTVYRALKLLIGVGLAHRIETLNAFVACRLPGEPHVASFRVCTRCGAAEETPLAALPPGIGAGEDVERIVLEVVKPCVAPGGCPAGDGAAI